MPPASSGPDPESPEVRLISITDLTGDDPKGRIRNGEGSRSWLKSSRNSLDLDLAGLSD